MYSRNSRPTRREVCLWLASCAAVSPRVGLAQTRISTESGDAALDAARALLERGDARGALAAYETLVREGESVAAELGLIRAALLAGEFRQAVATATLTAGEHPESAEAGALLAYVTDRSARTEQALRSLADLEMKRGAEWPLVAARAEILIDRSAPGQALQLLTAWRQRQAATASDGAIAEIERLARRAHAATGEPQPRAATAAGESVQPWAAVGFARIPLADANVVAAGSGVIVDSGDSVLTYAGAVRNRQHVFVRNALGHIRSAVLDSARSAEHELVRLPLDEPYPAAWSITPASVGGPESVRFCFTLAFGAPHSVDAAYPAMTPGVMVRAETGVGGLMQMSTRLGRGHDGAPVFDARGRLIGIGLASGEHTIAGAAVRESLGDMGLALRVDRELRGATPPAPVSRSEPQPPMPAVEELYERLAPSIVQIVATDRAPA